MPVAYCWNQCKHWFLPLFSQSENVNQIPLTPPTKVLFIYLEVFQYLKTIKGNDILKWKNDKAIWKERKK
jgi:hypothetical protein